MSTETPVGERPAPGARLLKTGYALIAVGLLVLIGGAILLAGQQSLRVLAATDRAEIPEPMRFTARDTRYSVVLLPSPLGAALGGDPAAEMVCDAELADGTVTTMRGARPGDSSLSTGLGETIGDFAAVAGPTVVRCAFPNWPRARNYYVAVAPQARAVQRTGQLALVAGIAGTGAGVLLVIVAYRRR